MTNKNLSFSILFAFPVLVFGQIPDGAWSLKNDEGITHKILMVNGYFSWTVYQASPATFISTKGGAYHVKNNQLSLTYEFNTNDTLAIGQPQNFEYTIHQNELWLKESDQFWQFSLIEDGMVAPLQGAWIFSGRERNGTLSFIDTDRPRKTMKLLTNNHFQWIAYNVATKEFFGTGGGAYTAQNEIYTEKIDFFSRDNQKVGLELSFQYEVKDNQWHHKGKSSTGNPIYEVWKMRD